MVRLGVVMSLEEVVLKSGNSQRWRSITNRTN